MLGDKKPVLMESDKNTTVATLGEDGKLTKTQLPDLTTESISGLTEALNGKQDTLEFDETPMDDSEKPVKSKGIKSYVDQSIQTAIEDSWEATY